MIESLILVLVAVLVACIVWVVLKLAAAEFGVPPVWVHIAGLIIFLILLAWVLRHVGVKLP